MTLADFLGIWNVSKHVTIMLFTKMRMRGRISANERSAAGGFERDNYVKSEIQ